MVFNRAAGAEVIYQRCLAIEMKRAGLEFGKNKSF